jgi:hypothetical protein
VPFAMGKKLFDAACEPKSFYAIDRAGHNDVLESGGEDYLMRLKSFIERGV